MPDEGIARILKISEVAVKYRAAAVVFSMEAQRSVQRDSKASLTLI